MPFVAGFLKRVRRPHVPGRPDIGLPDEPDGEDDGDEGIWQGRWPTRPGHPIYPTLPPLPQLPEELPPLPPFLKPGVGLPIPPTPEFPMVPVPPETGGGGSAGQLPVMPPGMVWPPVRPEWPDKPELGNKALALVCLYVSGKGWHWRWAVLDLDAMPTPPAGGIAGRPPNTRPPG